MGEGTFRGWQNVEIDTKRFLSGRSDEMQTRQSSVWLECSSHDLRLVGRSEGEHGKTNFQDAAKEGEHSAS